MEENKNYIKIVKELNYKPIGSVLLRLYGAVCSLNYWLLKKLFKIGGSSKKIIYR